MTRAEHTRRRGSLVLVIIGLLVLLLGVPLLHAAALVAR